MAGQYVYPLSGKRLPPNAGSKAENIHFLLRHGVRVPRSWTILWTAREDALRDSCASNATLRKELNDIVDPGKYYAVRSSASVEDAGDFSCAGLFKSYLQVRGVDDILTCIGFVWDSLESPEFKAYWQHVMPEGAIPRMAVMIQEMVQARFSGVVFTKNPVTGLSETIIEAGPGTGETQAESHAEPERWVSKWGNWAQKPEEPALDETLAREIVVEAARIAHRYKKPADLEWAWDGETLQFLQIRPITRLDIPVYSNRIAREMLPGIIKPLVWSVNTRLINPAWAGILGRLTGERSWDPDSFTSHFYYRAYFNMGIFARVFERLGMPGEALELLFGLEHDGPDKPHMRPGPAIAARLPQLLAFALSFAGVHARLRHLAGVKKPAYEKLAARMEEAQEPEELLRLASQIFDETRDVAYYNIMIPLLAMMHYRLLASLLKKHGYDVRALELMGAREAADRYNPQHALQALHDRHFRNSEDRAGEGTWPDPEREEQLMRDIDRFLQDYGHFSDSGNDCSSIPWRETPDLIQRMIARPQQTPISEQQQLRFEDLTLPRMQGFLTGMLYRRTSRFAVSREEISSLYTYGYGQFRTCFARLGEQLARQGVIDDREDVYYLYWQELSELIEAQEPEPQHALIASRRQAIEDYRDAALPEMILGSEQPPVEQTAESALRGIPTSLGTYTGPARVIRGINEFEKLQDGDVLIIPFSDVGWTPLFAKAGAVVSESGGVLSHSSILAREYRIPAVVSVAGACRLEDNIRISVNGYTGDIVLL